MTYPWNMDRCFNLSDPGRQFGDHQSRALADQSHAAADASEAPFWCGHWVIDPRYISNSCWFHKPGEWWYAMSPHQYPIKKTWVFDGWSQFFLVKRRGVCSLVIPIFVENQSIFWYTLWYTLHYCIYHCNSITTQLFTWLITEAQQHVLVSDAVVLRQVS